jgi:hypothetical protein
MANSLEHEPFEDRPRPRVADFDEQMWPHYLVLLGLVVAAGLSIAHAGLAGGAFANPLHDPRPWHNAWVHYLLLAAGAWVWLVLTAILAEQTEHRRVLLSMQLSLVVLYVAGVAVRILPPPTPNIHWAPVLGVLGIAFAPVLAHKLASRYPGTHLQLVLAGGVLGGLAAWGDHQGHEILGAAVVGALAAQLFGGLLLGLVGAVAPPIDGERAAFPRWFSGTARLAGVLVLAGVLYEAYWFLNTCAIAAANDASVRICQASDEKSGWEAIHEQLRRHRQQLAVLNTRPVRWFMRRDIAACTERTLAVIDHAEAVGEQLGEVGRQIKDQSQQRFESCINKPLLLRQLLVPMLATGG